MTIKAYYDNGTVRTRRPKTTEKLLEYMIECYSLLGESILGTSLIGWEVLRDGKQIIARGNIGKERTSNNGN